MYGLHLNAEMKAPRDMSDVSRLHDVRNRCHFHLIHIRRRSRAVLEIAPQNDGINFRSYEDVGVPFNCYKVGQISEHLFLNL